MNNEYFSGEMDNLLDQLGQWILEDEQQPHVLDPVRYQQFQFSHNLLQKLTADTDMKVSYETHKPFSSMGSICIEGEQLEFYNCRWLARAISFASNLEVYPLTSGKTRLVLTFHGLARKV